KSPQVRRTAGLPCATVLTAAPRSPRGAGLDSPRHLQIIFASLTSASGGSGVESRRGAVVARSAQARFLSPLIKPDVRISRIRLSDWLHRKARGGGRRCPLRRQSTADSP